MLVRWICCPEIALRIDDACKRVFSVAWGSSTGEGGGEGYLNGKRQPIWAGVLRVCSNSMLLERLVFIGTHVNIETKDSWSTRDVVRYRAKASVACINAWRKWYGPAIRKQHWGG